MIRLVSQLVLITAFVIVASGQSDAVLKTRNLIDEIVAKSYPELKSKTIDVKEFQSESDYFRARFVFSKFLTLQRMSYIVFVNPAVFQKSAAPEAIRAIVAHELAHVFYYSERNRMELLGLAGLSTKSFTQKFEHGADLEAIIRGYGVGLEAYRQWLYQNIPAKNLEEKKRNYYSPEEIEKLSELLRRKPELAAKWRKDPPRKTADIHE